MTQSISRNCQTFFILKTISESTWTKRNHETFTNCSLTKHTLGPHWSQKMERKLSLSLNEDHYARKRSKENFNFSLFIEQCDKGRTIQIWDQASFTAPSLSHLCTKTNNSQISPITEELLLGIFIFLKK